MFTLYDHSQAFLQLDANLKAVSKEIGAASSAAKHNLKVNCGQEISFDNGNFVLLSSGLCSLNYHRKTLAYFEPGDGILGPMDLPGQATLRAETDLSYSVYNFSDLTTLINKDPSLASLWMRMLEVQNQLSLEVAAQLAGPDSMHSSHLRLFNAGQAIIVQDTMQDWAYLLVKGYADVYVGETKVGEVLPGELFGALNPSQAATEALRTASVIARKDCIVAEFDQQEFQQRLLLHPTYAQKMLTTLSRIIVAQNQKIVTMTN